MYDRRLELFIDVVDCGSFTKAAGRAYISPTAIMKQMNALESEYGFKLLVRSAHGVTATSAGKRIYAGAKKVIALSDDIIASAKAVDDRDSQEVEERLPIRIGSSVLFPYTLIMRLLSQGSEYFSQFDISIVVFDDGDDDEMFEALGKSVDIVVACCDVPRWTQNHTVFPLGNMPLTLAVPRGSHLVDRDMLQVSDLDGECINIVRPGATVAIDRLRNDLEWNHPGIRIIDCKDSYDMGTFTRCAQEGTLMLSCALWGNVHPAFVDIPVNWQHTATYGILAAKQMKPNVLRFFEAIQLARGDQASGSEDVD